MNAQVRRLELEGLAANESLLARTAEKRRAVIFDLDGLLVDSEPLWHRAEMVVFGRLGLKLSTADCESVTGLRTDMLVAHWYRRSPWEGASLEAVTAELESTALEMIAAGVQARPGAIAALDMVTAMGLPMGVASSSPMEIIEAALTRVGVGERFRAICSAQGLALGKPHPEVYLNCAAALGVAAEDCLAFEDSGTGLLAAKAARMKAVAVPAQQDFDHPWMGLADLKLGSLEQLRPRHLAALLDGS